MSQENVPQDMGEAYEGQNQRASQPQPSPLIGLGNNGLPAHGDEFAPGHLGIQFREQSRVTAAQSSFRHNDLLLMDYQGPSLHTALPQLIVEVQRLSDRIEELSDMNNELWATTQENMKRMKASEDRIASLERDVLELRSRQQMEASCESDSDIE